MNGLPSYESATQSDLKARARSLKAKPQTNATWTRVAIACGVVLLSLLALLYLDDAFVSSPDNHPQTSSDMYAGYGINTDDGSSGSKNLPKLVSGQVEPDSKTINPATAQLPLRKAVIVSSYKDQNVAWLDKLSRVSRG